MANEEKTKVLAAQTPLASADGVDAIAVRKGNGIELLAPAKLTVGAANIAGGISCPWLQTKNKTIAEFKQMIADFVGGKTEKVTSFSFSASAAWIENFDNDSYVIADGMMWTAIVDGIYTSPTHFSLSVSSYNQQRKFNIIRNSGVWSIKEVVLADVGGAPTKAKGMDTENIKGDPMSVTDFKNVLKNFVNRHDQGAVAQASLANTWASTLVGTDQSARIQNGSTMSLTIVCKASNDYWSVLVVGYGLVDGVHLISYYNGIWGVYRFGMTSVTAS